MATPNTADRLLDSAQRMVQLRGFNAFSYADLAEEIGIRSASIHYHFKTKVDLGEALLGRYVAELEASLEALDGEQVSARQRLELLIDGYRDTERCGFMCLCGSLASDVGTLPPSMRSLIDEYLSRTEAWVTREIERGARSGEFKPVAAAEDLASMLVCGLQGALLTSRARGGSSRLGLPAVERSFFAALGA